MGTPAAVSYSSTRTYLECPLRWKFLYVDELKEAPRGYFSFGRTLHSVLEEFVRPLVVPTARRTEAGGLQRTLDEWPHRGPPRPAGRLLSADELLGLYRDSWEGEGYTSAEEETRYRALGAEILLAYREDVLRQPPSPVAVEEHLSATWEGIPVHGFIDRIDRTPGGSLEVVDYKTSRELSIEDAKESDQLSLYQVLVERNYAEPVERLTLYHLRSRTPHSTPRRDAETLDEVHQRFGRAYDGIRAASYEPTPGRHCSRCEFRSLCPEFKTVPTNDRERLQELVDRFHALRSQEERVDRELRLAAEQLHQEAERLGVHRIPGSERVAIRRREEVWRYREESVAPILAEHELGGRIRADDHEALRRLAQDRKTPVGLRRQLANAGGRQVKWYWTLEEAGN